MNIANVVHAAKGRVEADLLLTGAKVINVFTGEIEGKDILIIDGYIASVEKGLKSKVDALEVSDIEGAFVAPGFIDAHIHIESTMLTPHEFARIVAPSGTAAVVADPHEIANVHGVKGIEWMLEASENLPIDFFFMLPSCVPATHLETSGAELAANDLLPLYRHERVLGLAEVMNFPGVINLFPDVVAKIEDARSRGLPVDGHAPGVTGSDLAAYVAAGITSDHECTELEEAREKLAAGMYLFLRQGSTEQNLETLLPAVTKDSLRRCCLVSDDRHPDDLMDYGHLDYSLRICVKNSMDPVDAIRMATINPAERFGLKGLGAVAPGYRANLVVMEDLEHFKIRKVYSKGVLIVENGISMPATSDLKGGFRKIPALPGSFKLNSAVDFQVNVKGSHVNVIEIVENQIVTRAVTLPVTERNGMLVADPGMDLAKLAVLERHKGTGNIGIGMVKGMGLKKGAIAGTVAHDSHNIIVAGVDDRDMKLCVGSILANQGGFVVVCDGAVLSELPLPVAGLMSVKPVEEVRKEMDILLEAARELGISLANPFMTLSFLALPVIPELKLTDRGLVDVTKFDFVPLFTQ